MNEPDSNRQIRVFISSTFRDMRAERDILIKNIFPQLRKLRCDLLINCSRRDNGKDLITRLVELIKADFTLLAARSRGVLFDLPTIRIRKEVPWQN